MFPQNASPRRGKATFFLFFNTVQYQISPQMACLRGCIVTPVTFCFTFHCCGFSNLISTVRFQMLPPNICMGGCKVTLATFDGLFSTVLSNVFSNRLHEKWHSHIGCIFFYFIPLCLFKSDLSALGSEQTKYKPQKRQSHIGCIVYFSLLCVIKCVLKWPA